MMHNMNTIGMDGGFGFSILWIVHILSVVSFAAGLVFLLAWAVKTLPIAKLLQWAIGLLIGGAIACLITIGIMGHPWTSGSMMGGNNMMYRVDSEDRQGMGMMRGSDMGMMSKMGMMLDGLEGDEFDEAFIRMMIPHHEGAIDMAEEALKSAKHPEMKQLATDIIEAQQREIDMMKGWQREWGYTQ